MPKVREEYLDVKSLDYILSIISTDMDEQEKAIQLYKYCDYKSINDNLNYRTFKNKESRETKRLIEIKKVYDDYKKKGYFDSFKASFKCNTKEIEIRINKLNTIYEIINSNISDYNKAYYLYLFYKNSASFKRTYSLFIKYGEGDIRLEEGKEALDNFDMLYNNFLELENNGIMDNIKYITKINDYFINYEYAKFIINSYIEEENSYRGKTFFDKFGIDKDIFDFCIKTIEELDVSLYNQFLNKKKENNKIRFYKSLASIKELITGINTGYLSDGTPFNILIFIKKIPFKANKDFTEIIASFMKNARLSREDFTTIMNYIYSNNLHLPNTFKELEAKKLHSITTIINGRKLTNEEIDKIIKYLTLNNIPVINISFNYVKNQYLNGELNIDDEIEKLKTIPQNKEYTKILIPTKIK